MDINDENSRISELKKSMADLCEDIHKDTSENKFDKIEKFFLLRQNLVDEIFSMTKTRDYTDEIIIILNWVHEQDGVILNILFKERDKIKISMQNQIKIKHELKELS